MKHSLLVLSGGMDSVTMLHEFASEIALAVYFNYGSNHILRERECARHHCKLTGIELVEINLDFMSGYFESSLLQGAEAIPEGSYDDINMKSTVVPFRNGIMLSIAAGMAESRGLDTVLIASHGGDHAIYPDCRASFIDAMSRAVEIGTYAGIKISAPYTYISKGEIACHGRDLGIDYSTTYSCYKGGEKHCGKCGTCVERREAFKYAGIKIDD